MGTEVLTQSLNIGVVDVGNLHRTDLERMRLTAELQTNLICDAVGKASLRPGTQFLGENIGGRLMSFIAGEEDGFLLELTHLTMQIRDPDDDDNLITRGASYSTIADGGFDTGVGWTLSAEAGQTSQITGSALSLACPGRGSTAYGRQLVTTTGPNQEHVVSITVQRGPVQFRIGSTATGDDYLATQTLKTGSHSLAFTPAGSFWIDFSSKLDRIILVTSCTMESASVMTLATPWQFSELALMRVAQSIDVMFVACEGNKQQRIERRGDHSWSIVEYTTEDGPFLTSASANLRMTPSVLSGNGTLTASASFFKTTHTGALFRLYHDDGQRITQVIAGLGEHTDSFVVTGVADTGYDDRNWVYTVSGTWVGTIRVQRSFDGPDAGFQDFRRDSGAATIDITANAGFANTDTDNNAQVWYRFYFAAYTSGAATIVAVYGGGGGAGICRVTSITSSLIANIEVLTPFKTLSPTRDWQEGAWSDEQGYPSAVALADGRLWWFGEDYEWASVSDSFESFDDSVVGDAGPMARSIALGGRNKSRWAVAVGSLMVGCDSRVVEVRASSIGEVLTPENFNNKPIGGKVGVAAISPVETDDDRVMFVHASGNALYEVNWSGEKGRYLATEFSKLTKDIFFTGITGMAVQERPDQRIWVTNRFADAVCIVFDPSSEVVAHIPISTKDTGPVTDFITSVAVLPGERQDRVYFMVSRLIGIDTKFYTEKLAFDIEAQPRTISKCMDSHVEFGAGVSVVNLIHLAGRTVVGWMDGAPICDAGTTDATEFVVPADGNVDLPSASVTGGVLGLPYLGRYKSPRLAYGVNNSTPMLKNKALTQVGLMLANYCRSGVKFGTQFDNPDHPLFNLPLNAGGTDAAEIVLGNGPDEDLFPTGGAIGLDERLCLEVRSPKPATFRAIVMAVETYGKQ